MEGSFCSRSRILPGMQAMTGPVMFFRLISLRCGGGGGGLLLNYRFRAVAKGLPMVIFRGLFVECFAVSNDKW